MATTKKPVDTEEVVTEVKAEVKENAEDLKVQLNRVQQDNLALRQTLQNERETAQREKNRYLAYINLRDEQIAATMQAVSQFVNASHTGFTLAQAQLEMGKQQALNFLKGEN